MTAAAFDMPIDATLTLERTASAGKILSIDHVTVSFDGFKAVDDLSMSIDENELRVIIGPNGAGKTTLLDMICGKTRPTSGSIRFRDVELTKLAEFEIVRLGVGRKFQNPSIYEDLTVGENLEISIPQAHGVWASILFKRTPQVRERIGAVAEQVFLLADLLHQKARPTLSHGQKQWLEIGMLLMQEPELLLLDEPVAGMSARERETTAELLGHISKGKSVIVIEHDMEFVKRIAQKVTVLHQGKLLSEGTVAEVPKTRASSTSIGHLTGAALLDVRDLDVRYGESRVICGVSFSVAKGETLAIMGRNGMGKTTLLKALIGMLPTRGGSIRLDGTELAGLKSHRRVAAGLGFVPQGRMIFSHLTVEENILWWAPSVIRSPAMPDCIYRLLPGAAGHAAAQGRQPVRRPAADAGDRARADIRPESADPRRTDRGHPALDHQGAGAHAERAACRTRLRSSCPSRC